MSLGARDEKIVVNGPQSYRLRCNLQSRTSRTEMGKKNKDGNLHSLGVRIAILPREGAQNEFRCVETSENQEDPTYIHYHKEFENDQLPFPFGTVVSDADYGTVGPGFKSRKRHRCLKCIVPSRHGNTLNSHRAACPLVRLLEGGKKWEAPKHLQGVLPQIWGGTEQSRSVACMVLKAKANDRRTNLALHRDEFLELRSDVTIDHVA
ncbi:uncharacterized protein TNCV_3916101 [Trichonephila clavipes]|nr:uncharacterized protein TNCV_3916101 [Trichonephila clavipes]